MVGKISGTILLLIIMTVIFLGNLITPATHHIILIGFIILSPYITFCLFLIFKYTGENT